MLFDTKVVFPELMVELAVVGIVLVLVAVVVLVRSMVVELVFVAVAAPVTILLPPLVEGVVTTAGFGVVGMHLPNDLTNLVFRADLLCTSQITATNHSCPQTRTRKFYLSGYFFSYYPLCCRIISFCNYIIDAVDKDTYIEKLHVANITSQSIYS